MGNPQTGVGHGLETVPQDENFHEQVIPDWAEATTISMLGPLTCSALTVMDPVFPLGELVCSLTMTLMPPGNEMATLGLDTRTDCPAATTPTSSAFPVTAACPFLQVALEFDFTTSAATKPRNRFRFATDDCDWLLIPLPDVVLFSASAEAKPKTLTLARDVLRFPPLAASGPVSERSSEIPSAFARKATASPLNVMVACAKLATGLKTKIAIRQIKIVEFFAFICNVLLQLKFKWPPRAMVGLNGAERMTRGW